MQSVIDRLLIIFPLLILSGCNDVLDSIIPSTPVRIELRSDGTGQPLATPGGHLKITTRSNEAIAIGYGGVLIVRGFQTDNEVYAFDLACPVENHPQTRLEVKDGIKAYCPACESEFDGVFYGNILPSSGPAKDQKRALRRYAANYTGFIISVYN